LTEAKGESDVGLDNRKHQKKLERRKAKDRARAKAEREHRLETSRKDFELVPSAPILHCFYSKIIWEAGIGFVLLSRTLPGGKVAFARFLIDMYCVGVKNVDQGIVSAAQYESDMISSILNEHEVEAMQPACARKLIEGSVAFAARYRLAPAAEYASAMRIFGTIDAAECTQEFVYGRNGKPVFIQGPYDSEQRTIEILEAIERGPIQALEGPG